MSVFCRDRSQEYLWSGNYFPKRMDKSDTTSHLLYYSTYSCNAMGGDIVIEPSPNLHNRDTETLIKE